MSGSAAKEFAKVRLEASQPADQDENDGSSGSDTESEAPADDPQPEYETGMSPAQVDDAEEVSEGLDAIKWAIYRDSTSPDDRGDIGWIGWHYHVMWAGYLQSFWDTEEPCSNFNVEKNGQSLMLTEFWEAAGRPMRKGRGNKWHEPPGRMGEIVHPPKRLIKKWLKAARPRRSYELFKVRLQKEKDGEKIKKRDSDYYWEKGLKRKAAAIAAAKAAAEATGNVGLQVGDPGPSTQLSRSAATSQDTSAGPSRAGSASASGSGTAAKIAGKGKEKAKETDPALASLFSDDEIVVEPTSEKKKKKKKKKRNTNGEAAQGEVASSPVKVDKGKGEEKEQGQAASSPVKVDKGKGKEKEKDREKKRKHDPDIITTEGQGPIHGPEKKKKSASPTKAPRPFIPPTPTTTVIPPTPNISKQTPATSSSVEASTSSRPRGTMSPTPTPPVSQPNRRINQEPLFLDSAPSPADTFGEPLPGIFGSGPSIDQVAKAEPVDLSTPSPAVHEASTADETFEIMDVDPTPAPLAVPGTSTNERSRSKSKSPAPAPAAEAASGTSPDTDRSPAAVENVLTEAAKPNESRQPSPLPEPTTSTTSESTIVMSPLVHQTSAPFATAGPAERVATKEKSPLPDAQNAAQKQGTGASPSAASLPQDGKEAAQAVPDIAAAAETAATASSVLPTVDAGSAAPVEVERVASPVGAIPPVGNTLEEGEVSEALPVDPPQQPTLQQHLVSILSAPQRPPVPLAAEPHSPLIEPPAPTFTSPRQVSVSPSEPMELDDNEEPLRIVEEASKAPATGADQGLGISPPRYVHDLPPKDPIPPIRPVQLPKSPPPKTIVPIAERPKYVQPSRVQLIADVVDPEAEARRFKQAAKKASAYQPPPTGLPSRLPARDPALVPQARPPMAAPPTQPRGFGNSPPSGPSGSGYASRGGGPLADQKELAPLALSHRAPWQARKQGSGSGAAGFGGGVSPANSFGGQSPLYAPPAGPSAMRTDQWRPVSPMNAGFGGQSPAWNPNMPYGAGRPGGFQPIVMPGGPQQGGQSPFPPAGVDPRGGISPSVMSPNPSLHAQYHPQAVDPRQMGSSTPIVPPGQSPLHPPQSPGGGSGSVGPRRIGRITATLMPPNVDADPARFHLTVMMGALNGHNPIGDKVLNVFLGPQSKGHSMPVFMEEVDATLIGWQIHHGARPVQWAKAAGIPEESKEWDKLKVKAMHKHRAWATFTENPSEDNTVVQHFAVVLVQARVVEQAIHSLGLGQWTSASDISMAILVLALPLDSDPPPLLPNPVQPELEVKDEKPRAIKTAYPLHILASYDLTPNFFYGLKGTRTVQYPGQQGHYDILSEFIEHEFKEQGVIPHNDQYPPETVLFANSKSTKSVRSATLAATISRRTKFYAAGPAMHLLPSQWGMREIWVTGGLVTFSPTFVLRSPAKFAEIMKMIRVAPHWAAYVTPQLVQWVHISWKLLARCPDPSLAYQTFTQCLFFDNHLLRLSGSPAAAGGGLSVSTCPPLLSHGDKCARWLEWLQAVTSERDYSALVNHCHDHAAFISGRKGKMGMGMDIDPPPEPELELVDIERKQIEDLTAMHKRPHLLPYRRYIYVGEVSLSKEQKDRIGSGIEYVDPDQFAAMFSGAQ